MEKIIVGFSKPSSNIKFPIFAWLIMLVDQTTYSHVYIRWYSDSLDRDIVYQASSTMVNFMGKDVFAKHAQVVSEFEIECSAETMKKTKQFALDKAGYPYGIRQVLGIFAVKVASWLGHKMNNPFDDDGKTYVCSELVGEILKEKFSANLDIDLDNVAPKDIFNLLLNLKDARRIV